jgi:hypothetical protein
MNQLALVPDIEPLPPPSQGHHHTRLQESLFVPPPPSGGAGDVPGLLNALHAAPFYDLWRPTCDWQDRRFADPGTVVKRGLDKFVVMWTQCPVIFARRVYDGRCLFMLTGTTSDCQTGRLPWTMQAFSWINTSISQHCPELSRWLLERLDDNLRAAPHYVPPHPGLRGTHIDADGLLAETHRRLADQIQKLASDDTFSIRDATTIDVFQPYMSLLGIHPALEAPASQPSSAPVAQGGPTTPTESSDASQPTLHASQPSSAPVAQGGPTTPTESSDASQPTLQVLPVIAGPPSSALVAADGPATPIESSAASQPTQSDAPRQVTVPTEQPADNQSAGEPSGELPDNGPTPPVAGDDPHAPPGQLGCPLTVQPAPEPGQLTDLGVQPTVPASDSPLAGKPSGDVAVDGSHSPIDADDDPHEPPEQPTCLSSPQPAVLPATVSAELGDQGQIRQFVDSFKESEVATRWADTPHSNVHSNVLWSSGILVAFCPSDRASLRFGLVGYPTDVHCFLLSLLTPALGDVQAKILAHLGLEAGQTMSVDDLAAAAERTKTLHLMSPEATSVLIRSLRRGTFLVVDGSVGRQRKVLEAIPLPPCCPTLDQQGMVPYVPSSYYTTKVRGENCLLEALVAASGHKLLDLGLSALLLEKARLQINDPVNVASIGALQRAFRLSKGPARHLSLRGLDFTAGEWLPIFVGAPMPSVLLTLHPVLDGSDTYHWCAVNLAALAIFIGHSPRLDRNREDFVEGTVIVEPADLDQGEAYFADYMKNNYRLGAPVRVCKLMVNARGVRELNFYAPELFDSLPTKQQIKSAQRRAARKRKREKAATATLELDC